MHNTPLERRRLSDIEAAIERAKAYAEAFVPLAHLRQEVNLPWRYLPALTYGTAALLCLNSDKTGQYDRYLDLYLRALPRMEGTPYRRSDILFAGDEV